MTREARTIFMTHAFWSRVSAVGACLAAAVCVTGNADTGTAAAPGSPQPGASAPDSPLRAFWREPDYVTLMAAGHYLEATRLPAQQHRIEEGQVDVKAAPGMEPPGSHPPQRDVIPEFEAMKQALAKGVVAPKRFWQRPVAWTRVIAAAKAVDLRAAGAESNLPAPGETVQYLMMDLQIRLPPVKASHFKHLEEVGRPSANAHDLSAEFGVPYETHIINAAHWVDAHYSRPYVSGAWDVGTVKVKLSKPVYETTLDSTKALEVVATAGSVSIDASQEDDGECASTGLWAISRSKVSAKGDGEDSIRTAYPAALFRTQDPIDIHLSKVDTIDVSLTMPPGIELPADSDLASRFFKRGRLISVDLDGDGIPDIALWEAFHTSATWGKEALFYRRVFVNAGGAWYVLDTDEWLECIA
jgi:hypothetical protein